MQCLQILRAYRHLDWPLLPVTPPAPNRLRIQWSQPVHGDDEDKDGASSLRHQAQRLGSGSSVATVELPGVVKWHCGDAHPRLWLGLKVLEGAASLVLRG